MTRVRVGTQGWSYDDWDGRFYPPGLRSGDRLELYARAFDAVEVDSTFYAHPPVARLHRWRDQTPDDFMFTLKMPGEITHELGLEDPRPGIRFCRDARVLGSKLGAVLVQLPPHHGPAAFEVTAAFLRSMPEDVPVAIEFRDRAWLVPETFGLLEEVGVTLALSTGPWLDEPAARDRAAEAPGPTLYLRWLGKPARREVRRVVMERDRELAAWAECIPRLPFEVVYAFLNNDYQGHAPSSARRLQELLGQTPVPPRTLSPQQELW